MRYPQLGQGLQNRPTLAAAWVTQACSALGNELGGDEALKFLSTSLGVVSGWAIQELAWE